MNWNDLPFFIAIAGRGTLAGAARELGVNHSTVFRRINAFEQKLGVRVFERLPEGYVLTEAGEEILGHARQANESILTLERAAAGRDFQLTGHIRITTPLNLAIDYLAPCITEFHSQYPGIQVEVSVSDADYDLSRRDADMALRASGHPPEHLIGRKIMDLHWHLCAGHAYLAQNDGLDNLAQLSQHRVIGAAADLLRIPAFTWLSGQVPTANMVCQTNSLDTMAAMTLAGLGLAVLPSDMNRPGIVRLMKLEHVAPEQLWILTHPDLRNVARIKAFSQFLFEYLQNHPALNSSQEITNK